MLKKLRELLPEIDYKKALTICGDDEDFYLEIFKDFTELPIKTDLLKCMSEGDYKNYCIHIHGFKNNAYSVGANAIGDLAYEMEKITREEISVEIPLMQAKLFEQYDRICTKFKNMEI